MIFLPRHPVGQDVMNRHDETSGTAEAGVVVALVGDKKVAKITSSGQLPYGLLGQPVVAPIAGLPQGYQFPGQIGSAEAKLGDPVQIFHGGIFETTQYAISGAVDAGTILYAKTDDAASNGKLCKLADAPVALGIDGAAMPVAQVINALAAEETAAGAALLVKALV